MDRSFFDPGALNHRLSLERSLEEPDGCGGLTTSWHSVALIWAKLKSIDPLTTIISQQKQEIGRHRIIIRYRDDVESGWRFLLNDRIFEIVAIHDPDEQHRYLVCQTEEQGR